MKRLSVLVTSVLLSLTMLEAGRSSILAQETQGKSDSEVTPQATGGTEGSQTGSATQQSSYDRAMEFGYLGSPNDWFWGDPCFPTHLALRFGWWGTHNQGSPVKTGEYQDLSASPFFDVDGLLSDGYRTFDFSITGLDNEADDARLLYYGSHLTAKLYYERYPHRLEHDPVPGTPFPPGTPYPPGPGFALPGDVGNVRGQDLNLGQDYAIRVQEFAAKFQGHITDNLKWRLNLWGIERFGERQTNATAHCFNTNVPAAAGANGNSCHVLSQRQSIDWTTTEIQPVLEGKWGWLTAEYALTYRSFGQDDQLLSRTYTRFGFNLPAGNGFEGPPYFVGYVPENNTLINRLKLSADLTESTQVYANLYYGETENEFRDTEREFGGWDVRIINRGIEGLTLTGYASQDDENNQIPPFFFNKAPYSPPNNYDEGSIRHPVDRSRTRAGIRGRWVPFSDECLSDRFCYPLSGFSLAAGYEYYELARDHAVYPITLSANPTVEGEFRQPDTKTNRIEFGPQMRWPNNLDTYVRYVGVFQEDPLIGVREHNGAFNTKEPEQSQGVEIGENWAIRQNLMVSSQFGIINRWHDSQYADFNEDDYPIVCTIWYAPCERLSLTAGYSYNSNWVDQDITLGFTVPGVPVPPLRTETTRWSYGGTNQLFSIGANYMVTQCLHVMGGYEWDHGTDVSRVPASPAGANWSKLPAITDVEVVTQRATAGIDWKPRKNTDVYFRYVYFDFDDIGSGFDSGTSNMFLAGVTLVF